MYIKTAFDLIMFSIKFPVTRKFMVVSDKTLTEGSLPPILESVTKSVATTSFSDRLRNQSNTGTNIHA